MDYVSLRRDQIQIQELCRIYDSDPRIRSNIYARLVRVNDRERHIEGLTKYFSMRFGDLEVTNPAFRNFENLENVFEDLEVIKGKLVAQREELYNLSNLFRQVGCQYENLLFDRKEAEAAYTMLGLELKETRLGDSERDEHFIVGRMEEHNKRLLLKDAELENWPQGMLERLSPGEIEGAGRVRKCMKAAEYSPDGKD